MQPKAAPKSKRPEESKKVASGARVDSEVMQSRMSQWFARAGISPTSSSLVEPDKDKRLRRHQHVKSLRKLQNLERILDLSLGFSLEQGRQEDLDPDWFFSFVDMAENIHSHTMQELWAKIFAFEVSRPGTFSLRTLQTLKGLTARDAQAFKVAVSLASRKKGEYMPRLIIGYYQKPSLLSFLALQKTYHLNLAEYGLAYPDLLSLMDMGLVYSSEIESGEVKTESRSEWRCSHQTLHLAAQKKGTFLHYYKFTATGAELARLVAGKDSSGYIDDLKALLSRAFEIT